MSIEIHKILIAFFDSIQVDKQTGKQGKTICHRCFLYSQTLSDCTICKQSVYFIKEYLEHVSICWSMVLGDILRSPQKKERKKITAFWKDTIYKTVQNQVYELIKIPHISIYLGYVW